MDLEARLSLEELQDAENINELLSDEDSEKIGLRVEHTYKADRASRKRWERKNKDATELALQIVQEKSYPWTNSANVKFPLLTIASLQFAARAYPALIKAPDLVKYRVQGRDPDGAKAARAARVSAHMSYQLLEEDEKWEEDQDKGFIALPILGCMFKKSYYDPVLGHNCSRLVLPKSLVVHYYARSLEECERKTEIFHLYEREIKERVLKGIFTDHELPPVGPDDTREEDERQGLSTPFDDKDRPRTLLEQHCFLDLDGDDYKEPYVVTIDEKSRKVLRIVHRFEKITTEQGLAIEELLKRIKEIAKGVPAAQGGESPEQLQQAQQAEITIQGLQQEVAALAKQKPNVLRIAPVEHYTKYSFIPSPDGGFYDLGFGALLGPLNDSVNTLLNMMIDSGSLQNGSVGFIGKGARIKGGKIRFSPNEWKRVNVAGGTLRDSLVPLPINPPSEVLFNLLSLLISYSERVASVTDAMTGENPGQNTPAYNMSAMLEQGMQVFNGIFKRVYRSQRAEFRKLYRLNRIYLDMESYFSYQDSDTKILNSDYSGDEKDLIPAADPNAFSNKEKLQKAQIVGERASTVPGYDMIRAEQRLLEAADIPDAAELYPVIMGEDGSLQLKFPPQPDPQLELDKAELQVKALDGQEKNRLKAEEVASGMAVDEANIILIMAKAAEMADKPELERLKLLADEMSDKRKAVLEIYKADKQAKKAEA